MFNSEARNEAMCENFLLELEELPVEPQPASDAGDLHATLRALLSREAREHELVCPDCRNALLDLVQTRDALRSVPLGLSEPGPYFVPRVMALIAARQNELIAGEGVWVNVPRLAPRLVAFSVALLILGGTWAVKLRHEDVMRQTAARPFETIFDSATIAPLNDDVLVSPMETHP